MLGAWSAAFAAGLSVPSQMTPDASDLLVVGLGNPGPDYARSRHNVGWTCLEELARRLAVKLDRKRWQARVGAGPRPETSGKVWLLMPQTFMNLSGEAVRKAVRDLRLDPSAIWVVYDEIDLPLCRLRIRVGGRSAGHNGVRSIIAALGTDDFVRFRVGVGRPAALLPLRGGDRQLPRPAAGVRPGGRPPTGSPGRARRSGARPVLGGFLPAGSHAADGPRGRPGRDIRRAGAGPVPRPGRRCH